MVWCWSLGFFRELSRIGNVELGFCTKGIRSYPCDIKVYLGLFFVDDGGLGGREMRGGFVYSPMYHS